jgi:hypothetical protein
MWDATLWIYLINATLLITHEIDSAYWREWEMFRLPGGVNAFLVIHLPLVLIVLVGLVLVALQHYSGLIFSLALGLAGVAAFVIHMGFMAKGRREFRSLISLFILVTTLVASLVQGGLAVRMLFAASG